MNQNPQYQQQPQQAQQPEYQQQYYQAPPRQKGAFTNAVINLCSKAAPILAFVFLCCAAAAVVYYLVDGIVLAAQARSFRMFLNVFCEEGLSAALRYSFYAAVLALLKKVVK